MADPTDDFVLSTYRWLHFGYHAATLIDDTADELAALTSAPSSGPTLYLMKTGQSRNIDGGSENFGSPGMYSISRGGDINATRFVRVVDLPTTGLTVDQPIREEYDGVNDACPSFSVLNEGGGLAYGGFGTVRLTIRLVDPPGLFGDYIREGMMVVVYDREYGDGSLIAEGEAHSLFILAGAEVEDVDHIPVYTFTCGTWADLMSRRGMDGRLAIFMDAEFEAGSDIVGEEPMDTEETPLLATHPQRVISDLHAWKVIHYLMLNWMWADINGNRYRMAEVCDWRADTWNLDDGAEYLVPVIGVPEGSVMGAIAAMLDDQAGLLGYANSGGFTVTCDHEWKADADDVVDSISSDYVYSIRRVTGETHPVGQVRLVQAEWSQTDLDTEPLIVHYPTSRDSTGSVVTPALGFLITTEAGAERLGEGYYRRENARGDKLIVHSRGRTFDLHNLATYDGETWSVESWTAQRDADWLGPVERTYTFRRVG